MEKLYELADLTKKHKKLIEVLIPDENKSPLRKLHNVVFSEDRLDDKETMILVYGRRNITAFSRLKARLREILQFILVIQNNMLDDSEAVTTILLSNLRNMLISRVLILKNAYIQGIELLEKTLSNSLKYNFTENILLQSRQILIYYSAYKPNRYKFSKYAEIQSKYLHIYEWEIKAESYFLDLQNTNMQSLSNPPKDLIERCERYANELIEAKSIHTPVFTYNRYRVLAVLYEYKKDFKNLIKITDEIIKNFDSPGYKAPFVVSNLYIRKMWALIQSGQIPESIHYGSKVLPMLVSGSNIWYRILHYKIKAHLYNGEYLEAIKLLNSVLNHPKYSKINKYYIELFNTALGYIYLLIESGLVKSNKIQDINLPEFKLGKYLNTTPLFSKDKRGINVSILLMHIAFLLQRKDYNAIIDRTDSLNQYAYRYLRRDDSFRSNCMIKMVIQMTKADFHPVRTERYTADLRKQLSSVNLAGSGENIEIEIIPFEVLWEIMVKSL